MIFQEPMTSLNPVFTIGDQISEMFTLHEGLSRKAALERAVEMLIKVQIPAPERRLQAYPHQLSGGMRQRVMIAMALACNPEILIADEPTTALDVTVQAQILDLMLTLRQDYDTAIMMITHDLGVITEIASRVVVMYAGKVVEAARTGNIFKNPKHPYTRGLLQSIPKLGERARHGRRRLREIAGMVPSLYSLPEGCRFYPRCPDRLEKCRQHLPEILDTGEGHAVRCWLHVKEGER
jgi:peptide/nickel transport system ATP-binding protein/oligopeptide transport system ATP-binding protein